MAVAGNPWGNEIMDNNINAMLHIVKPDKFPPIPDNLSPLCKDFIIKCLNRDYDSRPTAVQLLSHPWISN